MAEVPDVLEPQAQLGPATFDSLSHVSLPCRNLEEGIAFYVDVLGSEIRVNGPIFASFRIAGVNVGIGTENISFIGPSAEYPHPAFYVDAGTMAHIKEWLTQCDIPTSAIWTRRGGGGPDVFSRSVGQHDRVVMPGGVHGGGRTAARKIGRPWNRRRHRCTALYGVETANRQRLAPCGT